ncbi:PREDICTED: trichohyalin isoform X2 [Dinoponera quadriceps]|nr:PREDICTED: trichohyalin isoform X2 [Dinoponera quadriceps]XP_014483264.1 PREDICTED: trichohyalin isoform X2 [Dinoponera quadriceps]
MQPGVTVALATVWLAVAAGVVGAVTPRPLRLSHDQYSPASPSRHGVQQDQADWRDHDPAKDQPLDLWISSQRSISADDSSGLSRNSERNFPSEELVKDVALSKQNSLAPSWQAWLLNIGGSEFAADKVDYGGMPETLPREVPLSESDDPFVADDTFQDQGPGSVEIYKLDLSKEKALLTATTPSVELPTKNKSKAPKKVDRVSSKTKTTEIKSTTSPESLHRQSNFFEEQRTETPVNRDAFGVGGVPELQVGCEGLAAWSHKTKRRSIDTSDKEEEVNAPAVLPDASSMIVNLDYDSTVGNEEDYEEVDELFRIRKMEELAAKRKKLNRGDIDPVLNAHYLNDHRPDQLPVRGDLGEIASKSRIRRENSRKSDGQARMRDDEGVNAKRETVSPDDDSKSRGRRLLGLAEANTEGFADDERKRAKRRTDWGFGEDEGVVSSDELQTVNERRRQHEMRYHQDAGKHERQQREPNSEVDNIRREYDRMLEQKRREEEERLRRMQRDGQRTPSTWQEQEERRRDEMRRSRYEEYRRRTDYVSTPRTNDEEERRRRLQEENARRSGSTMPVSDEEARRRAEERRRLEEERRRSQDEEARRRQEQYRSQQEAQRRKEEEERRRTSQKDPARNHSEVYRRRLDEHRRQWSERQRQEEKKRRQQDREGNEVVPANLMRSGYHRVGHPNELRQRDWERERRVQEEERRREQKLREYIARNRPINVNRTNERNDDEYRRRQEDELRLQDYNRRKQSSNVPPKSNQTIGRELFDERRLIEEARQRSRHPDPGAAKRRGPWAPTYIDPRNPLEEVRRRQEERVARERQQRYEAEERRKELARRQQEEEARRLHEERRKEAARREEEVRREQSRRYEEARKRLEEARVQAERRRQETQRERGWGGGRTVGGTRQPEATKSPDQDPRLQQHRRTQDSRPIPSYLVRDDSRLLAERLRQQERARLEAERRRQEEESRRQKVGDPWKQQQEVARLHTLPISARIIVRPDSAIPSSPATVSLRGSFENEIEFTGINPNRQGVKTSSFPAAPTLRPPAQSPKPCVWAVVQCCSRNNSRLAKCFESMGCPGLNWDANPCRRSVTEAARAEIMKFYAAAENP